MRVIQTGAREVVASVRFSPDGRVLTALGRQRVDVGTRVPVAAFTTAFRIDPATGGELRRTAFAPSRLAAASPCGTYLAHVPVQTIRGTAVLALVNLLTGESPQYAPALRDPGPRVRLPMPLLTPPLDLTFLPETRPLVLAVAAGDVTRINFGTAVMDASIQYPADWLYPSPDGRYLAAGHSYLRVRVWDGWQYVGELPFTAERMAASADGRFAAARADGVHVGRLEGLSVERVLPHLESGCSALAFSPDGRLLAAADPGGRVGIWDFESGELERTFGWGVGALHAVAFAPDGLTCAAGGTGGRVVVWDVDV